MINMALMLHRLPLRFYGGCSVLIKENSILEFSVGPGVNFDKYDTEFVPAGSFTLGWVIGK